MKKNFFENTRELILIIIMIILIGGITLQVVFFYMDLKFLPSIKPQNVTTFKIYPGFSRPTGTPIKFNHSELIVYDFFHAIKDIRPYWSNLSPVASVSHVWFLEIEIGNGVVITMHCSIPEKKGNIVIGELNKGGLFQSRALFQWYQKYSHLWLNPTESTN